MNKRDIAELFGFHWSDVAYFFDNKGYTYNGGRNGNKYDVHKILDIKGELVSEKEFLKKYKNRKHRKIKLTHFHWRTYNGGIAYELFDDIENNYREENMDIIGQYTYKEIVSKILKNRIKPLTKEEVRNISRAIYVKKFPCGSIYIGKTERTLSERFNKAKWQAFNYTTGINPHDNKLFEYPNYVDDYEVYILNKDLPYSDIREEEFKAISSNSYLNEIINVQHC